MNFVPDWIACKKNPEYLHYQGAAERTASAWLQLELPFPVTGRRSLIKVSGLVTNRDLLNDPWYAEMLASRSSVLKSDLAGRLPSGLFGANAAWWAIAVLAFNLSSAMKRPVGRQWVSKRLKAVRFP